MIDAVIAKAQASRTLIIYCLIGGTGATLDLVVFLLLTGAGTAPTVATVVSVSCGIVNNFILNVIFNYKVRDRLLLRFASFYGVGLLGVGLSAVFLYVLSDLAGAPVVVSKVVSIPVIVVAQFALNNVITFARSRQPITLNTAAIGVVDA